MPRHAKHARLYRAFAAVACAAALAGCSSHPGSLARVKADLAMPDFFVNTNAAPFRARDVGGSDKILYLSERARAYQLTGEIDKSTEDYLAAEAAYDALDDRPVVSISTIAGQGVGGTVANDNVLPYEGNIHERVMLYQLDAFNHIARQDWNTARAAVNNIVHFSEKARKRRDEAVRVAEETADKDGRFKFAALAGNAEFSQNMAATDAATRAFTDAMQNGYAYYFSAFVREVDGNFPDALMGYRRAAEVAPANTFVKQDIARMEAMAGTGGEAPADAPNVAVFFEEGYAPPLEEFKLSFTTFPVGKHSSVGTVSAGTDGGGGSTFVPIPTSTPLAVKFALPRYSQQELGIPPRPLVVSDGGRGVVAVTQMVGDFRALAARAFKERLPYIATRAAFRAIAKATAAAIANYSVKDKDGATKFAVMLGGILLTQGTEFADLRTWMLAPRYGHVARFRLDPGNHSLTIQHEGNAHTFDADVPESGTLLLHVISVPGRLVVDDTVIAH